MLTPDKSSVHSQIFLLTIPLFCQIFEFHTQPFHSINMKTIVFVALFALFALSLAATEPARAPKQDLEAAPAFGLGYGLYGHHLLHHGLLHHGLYGFYG